ncbi:MAG: pyrroline-5-carboxylate reductase [Verrucomicrobiota bacterium]|nr:pyrroline-5-carboxylate reductase [Verrucomicrobiota bacterium]
MSLQTNDKRYRLGFIGGGKLAGSVMRGLLRAGYCQPGEILVSEPNEAARTALGEELGLGLTSENAEVAEKAEVILVGVKPGVVLDVVQGFGATTEGKLIISLAAGTRVAAMEEKGKGRFMRAMTNTPAAVCQAATAIARGARTTDEDFAKARDIFGAIGSVVEVEEGRIDAATALSGSGPAFVYTMIEALAVGGTKCGLPAAVSLALATQTVRGAAQLALESGLSPDELRQMVITPGGTTAAGLAAMEKQGSAAGICAAIEAAYARAKEL